MIILLILGRYYDSIKFTYRRSWNINIKNKNYNNEKNI